MKFLSKSFLVFLLALLCFSSKVKADYIIAADLSYECLSGLNYNVELTIYAECQSDLGFDLDSRNQFAIALKSENLEVGTGSENVTFNIFKAAPADGEEINLFCETEPTNCNGGTRRGITKYTFRGNVNLNNYGGASDDWKFFWQQDFRTDEIPTLRDAEVEPYYVEATVNNEDFVCNSSPTFGGNAVLKTFTNEENDVDLFVNDPDGDELRYRIIAPRAGEDINLQYTNGANLSNPLGDGTSIDITDNGHLVFTPNTPEKLGLFDIEISEYRNGEKIGSVTRGIQINTFESINEAPVMLGFNDSEEFSAAYCVGAGIPAGDLVFKVIDPDGDNINTFLEVEFTNRLIRPSYAGRSGDTLEFQFVWGEFSSSYIGTHEMIVTATDRACPTPKSTTQTYTIEVRDNPDVSLPLDQTIPCVPNTDLEANLLRGNASTISYQWATWDTARTSSPPYNYVKVYNESTLTETSSVLNTNTPDMYAVKAIDQAGCESEYAHTELIGSYVAKISVIPYCFGDITNFTNNSTLKDTEDETHEFTEFYWDFDHNNQTSTDKNTSYEYTELGTYTVTHNFKTNYGCDVTLEKTIDVCNPPVPSFAVNDSCINSTSFQETTDYTAQHTCIPSATYWLINGEYVRNSLGGPLNQPFLNIPDDTLIEQPGEYDITYEVFLEAGCVVDTTMKVNINPIPKMQFITDNEPQPDFFLFCADPDTVLRAATIDSAAGGLSFEWYKDDVLTSVTDTAFATDTTGTYKITATDIKGCSNDSSITIFYPTQADFVYDTVCSLGNPVYFHDSTQTQTVYIGSWEWDFGDGNTSSDQNPVHTFAESKDYEVVLTVTDSVACKSTDTVTVYNTFLENIYNIDPDYRVKTLCAKNEITGYSVLPEGPDSHIDTIHWSLGDGRTFTFTNDEDEGEFATDGDTITFFYNSDNEYTIESYTRYNAHPEIHNNYCEYTFSDKVEILPEFDGRIVDFRNCVTDTSLFYFVRETGDLGIQVSSFDWLVAEDNSIDDTDPFNPAVDPEDVIFRSTDSTVEYYLDEQKAIDIYLIATDENNCESVIRADAQIKTTSDVWATIIDTCYGLPTTMQVYSDNLKVSDAFGILTTEGDTLLYSSLIRYAENKLTPEPFNYTFDRSGEIPIKIFVEELDLDPRTDDTKHCRTVVDTSVYIDPVPGVNFEWDTVCAMDEAVEFTDLSVAPPGEEILSWYWDFGDTTSSTLQNPTHVYKTGGEYVVSLTVETINCPATYTETIYVKHKPQADFYFGIDFPEAYVPLPFEDNSSLAQDNYIVDQYYNFKDGSDTLIDGFEPTVEHIYQEIAIYNVDYIITNNEGCKDTTTKRTDLNVYLELPTAFTPNGDANNDDLGLVYKSIIELYDFKIFNRWGELVFDAEGNLDKVWDGSYKEKLQEAGVYVAHVRALGAYDTQFNFKQNITLLR